MIDISSFPKRWKSEFLSRLLNDPDTVELSEAEYQDRLRRVVQRLYDAVEGYLKKVDRIRAEERRDLWTTSKQGFVSEVPAEVCARMKTILNEIMDITK